MKKQINIICFSENNIIFTAKIWIVNARNAT